MTYTIQILRRKNAESKPYWQKFFFAGSPDSSVAAVLEALNSREPLLDTDGRKAEPIAWERSCLVRKCGACAMRINGLPRLACAAFLRDLKGQTVILEPLRKFPPVKDLMVDRSVIFTQMKKLQLWLESDAFLPDYTHEMRYQSARCLMCGCCLEVCPNFRPDGNFTGAIGPVSGFRIFNEEQNPDHLKACIRQYQKLFFRTCGQSLACQNICPAGIPVEELMVRSNAAGVWKR